MAGRVAGLLVVLGALPWAAWAQVPAGPEFPVNTYTTGEQGLPSVAADAEGNFVVVWRSFDGANFDVFGRRFSREAVPLGTEFQVNTSGGVLDPAVASDASGNFVVVYEGGPNADTRGQRFSAEGTPLGAEFRVNTFTTNNQFQAAVASDANGNFIVVWVGLAQPGDGNRGIYGQRYSAAGAALGGEFRINTFTTLQQVRPSVASDASGNFVVAWDSNSQDGSGYGVFAQRFTAAGVPRGGEFRVNTTTAYSQFQSSIAGDASGNFVVVWQNEVSAFIFDGVFGQRFNAAGAPVGAQFRVATTTGGNAVHPSVAMAPQGGFVVTWRTDEGLPGAGLGIMGRQFNAAGEAQGAEFRVNSYTTGHQSYPTVASDGSGNYVVAWTSAGQDGSGDGAFAQGFGGLHPAALAVDTAAGTSADGNGVLEPGEFTDARPSWINIADTDQDFGGVFSKIQGPPGAFYALSDPDGDYSTVDSGLTGACTDCYGIAVSAPAVRPVLHWDATVVETLTPGIHGQTTRWSLHIGDSFTDVPRSNPFYRFVETLLHHGVTGGCAAGQYCPGSSTTRDQMSVFALVAKEGAGYVPPACTTPVFADVPASSPFCRFIEELARRGVVSGCGGGNYCPTAAVTREQMGVFISGTFGLTLYGP